MAVMRGVLHSGRSLFLTLTLIQRGIVLEVQGAADVVLFPDIMILFPLDFVPVVNSSRKSLIGRSSAMAAREDVQPLPCNDWAVDG